MTEVSSPPEYARTIFMMMILAAPSPQSSPRGRGGLRGPTITSPLNEDRHLIAKGNVDVTRGLNHFAVRWDEAQTVHRIGDRNVSHLIILVTDHGTEMSFVGQLHGFNSEARAQDPVERGWWPAALQMSKHTRPRFFSRSFRDLTRYHIPDSAQSKFAAFDIAFNLLAISWPRAFGHDNERANPARGFPLLYRLSNLVVIKRDLRNQDNVRAAGEAAVERDPAGVASHYFDNHHPFVARRRCVQTIESVHY